MHSQISRWYAKHYVACFLTPALLLLVAFAAYITISLVYLACCEWNISNPSPVFVGIQNFLDILVDKSFWKGLGKTAAFTICSVTVEILAGFLAAYTINQKIKLTGLVRTLVIVPMAMTPVVVGMFWKILYDPSLGPINYFLSLVGIKGPDWLGSSPTAFFSLLLVNVWEWMPFSFLVLTAGLNALPHEVNEAAMIDGANSLQIVKNVTIPMLKQVILTLVLLRGIDALKAFDLIFVMTRGGPGETTQMLPFYIYLRGFQWFDLGYASALSIVLLIIVNTAVNFYTSKTGVKMFYED